MSAACSASLSRSAPVTFGPIDEPGDPFGVEALNGVGAELALDAGRPCRFEPGSSRPRRWQ